jgi:hypothetical protein
MEQVILAFANLAYLAIGGCYMLCFVIQRMTAPLPPKKTPRSS